MLTWALIGLGLAAGGAGWAWTSARRPREASPDWPPLLARVAAKYGGRAVTARPIGLRGTVDGLTLTLSLFDVERGPQRTRAVVDVPVPDASSMRLHLAWDTLVPARGFDHVPVIDLPIRELVGAVTIRADDEDAASSFIAGVAWDLVDVRREALAEAVEVTVRGGYLQLTLHGMQADELTIDRVARVAARLAHRAQRKPGAE